MYYSRMANATLPSSQLRFTSEFGMGSGGSTALLPPGNKLVQEQRLTVVPSLIWHADVSFSQLYFLLKHLGRCMVKPLGQLV